MPLEPVLPADNYQTVITKVSAIINDALGAGSADNIQTWGEARQKLNEAAVLRGYPTIANFERGLPARSKINMHVPDPDAVALIARMTVQPSDTRKRLISTLVSDLKSKGVWDKLNWLHIFAAHDAQAARLNWKGTSATAVAVSSPIFTADRGYKGDGVGAYLNISSPVTTGTDINNLVFGARSYGVAAAQSRTPLMRSGNRSFLFPRDSTDTVRARINSTAEFLGASYSDRSLIAVEASASGSSVYEQGVKTGSRGTAGGPNSPPSSYLTDPVVPTYSDQSVSAGFSGQALGDAGNLDLFNSIQKYLVAVGAA